MTNKSVMTLISVNKISVCLSVWYISVYVISTLLGFPVNPLTAGAEYIGFLTQILPHSVPPFKHGKTTM